MTSASGLQNHLIRLAIVAQRSRVGEATVLIAAYFAFGHTLSPTLVIDLLPCPSTLKGGSASNNRL